jgi:hypothetical protein
MCCAKKSANIKTLLGEINYETKIPVSLQKVPCYFWRQAGKDCPCTIPERRYYGCGITPERKMLNVPKPTAAKN